MILYLKPHINFSYTHNVLKWREVRMVLSHKKSKAKIIWKGGNKFSFHWNFNLCNKLYLLFNLMHMAEIERIKLQKFESEIQAWEEKEKAKIDNKFIFVWSRFFFVCFIGIIWWGFLGWYKKLINFNGIGQG